MKTPDTLEPVALAGREWRDWYPLAYSRLEYLCREEGFDLDRFIDILAITSPRVSVKKNLRITIRYFRTGVLSGTIKSTKAALEHYLETGEIRGPKTSAFARALKGDPDAVVLDVWMSDALDVDQRKFSTKYTREEATKRIKAVAARLKWEPRQVQAALWCATVKQFRRVIPSFQPDEELTLWDGKQ